MNLDVLVRDVRSLPAPGEERFVDSAEIRTGGAAANAALALAALGIRPRLVGAVGDDPAGRLIRDDIAAHGLDLTDVRTLPGVPTGVSVALEAPDRDRSFLTAAGALAAFDVSMVPPDALGTAFVLVTGTFLLPGLGHEGTAALLRDAKYRGATVLFDPGSDPEGWPQRPRSTGAFAPRLGRRAPAERAGSVGADGGDRPGRRRPFVPRGRRAGSS